MAPDLRQSSYSFVVLLFRFCVKANSLVPSAPTCGVVAFWVNPSLIPVPWWFPNPAHFSLPLCFLSSRSHTKNKGKRQNKYLKIEKLYFFLSQ